MFHKSRTVSYGKVPLRRASAGGGLGHPNRCSGSYHMQTHAMLINEPKMKSRRIIDDEKQTELRKLCLRSKTEIKIEG
jgi:hypothetical protein